MLELVEAGEGRLWPQRCTLSGGPCRWDDVCAVHPAWEQAHTALSESLARTTLASIVAVDRELEAGRRPAVHSRHPEGSTIVRKGRMDQSRR
jgi:DNA-binding IscR family transcriptional regulator